MVSFDGYHTPPGQSEGKASCGHFRACTGEVYSTEELIGLQGLIIERIESNEKEIYIYGGGLSSLLFDLKYARRRKTAYISKKTPSTLY